MKGLPAENVRQPGREPVGSTLREIRRSCGVGEQLQLFSTRRQSPSREQPHQMPTVERRLQFKSLQVCSQLEEQNFFRGVH